MKSRGIDPYRALRARRARRYEDFANRLGGHNHNMCFVVPEWDLVLVRLGTDGNVDRKVWGAFFRRLAAALDPAR